MQEIFEKKNVKKRKYEELMEKQPIQLRLVLLKD